MLPPIQSELLEGALKSRAPSSLCSLQWLPPAPAGGHHTLSPSAARKTAIHCLGRCEEACESAGPLQSPSSWYPARGRRALLGPALEFTVIVNHSLSFIVCSSCSYSS